MKAIEYLKGIPRNYLPRSREGSKRGDPSNSELRRWLNKGSVVINGVKPMPGDNVVCPITELIFFPKRNKVTMVKENEEKTTNPS